MRGVHEGRFDATIKTVTNLDLRLNMPLIAFLVPGILIYFDSAVHDDLTGKLTLDPDRILFSTGGGIVLNLFGIDIALLINYFINEKLVSLAAGLGVHY
jgi:hypothetical protein